MYKKIIGNALVLMISVLLLSGCFTGKKTESNVSLKILSMYDRVTIEHIGLRSFMENNSEVSVEFIDLNERVSDPLDKYKRIEEIFMSEQPDVVITDRFSFGVLSSQNKLADLNVYIQQSNYPINDLYSGVRDWIIQNGDGLLNGLAPYFQSEALIYNYDLFEKYDIPILEDYMSWEEILTTAEQFAGHHTVDNPVYGYFMGRNTDPLALVDQMADTLNVKYVNWEKKLITTNTDSWHNLYEMSLNAYHSGIIHTDGDNDSGGKAAAKSTVELFLEGNIAIMPVNYDTVKTLLQSNTGIRWGLVTQPVDPNNRMEGTLSPMYIYSVNASAKNPEAAWRLVSELSQASIKQVAMQLPSWKPSGGQTGDVIETFYKLSYKPQPIIRFWEIPDDLPWKMHQIRVEGYLKALDGDIEVDEALSMTQAELEQILLTNQQQQK
ncbi:hypothetical protein A7K91_20765 [Paenibacillus oryzae]|uniref:ABC transporter substrate-binding protein n=1 Tax=Paenibacillus oryzae TaxID=1844972 RepID=A0A1A5YLC1_9BACL|nr:ABC transporter substrate-binding protein [Paenibacillus oryzae]OBR66170.1 hypothetical protein A7K91_20765 [Paenibacillus oryzae]